MAPSAKRAATGPLRLSGSGTASWGNRLGSTREVEAVRYLVWPLARLINCRTTTNQLVSQVARLVTAVSVLSDLPSNRCAWTSHSKRATPVRRLTGVRGHAEWYGSASGRAVEGGEFGAGSVQAGLETVNLTEPAVGLGLFGAFSEVGGDLFEPAAGRGFDPQHGAADVSAARFYE